MSKYDYTNFTSPDATSTQQPSIYMMTDSGDVLPLSAFVSDKPRAELRQGEYMQPSDQSNYDAWLQYQQMVTDDMRRQQVADDNARAMDLVGHAISPLTMATDLAGVPEDSKIHTIAELVSPGDVAVGGKMLVMGALGKDFFKKLLKGEVKPRPNAFNNPELRRPIDYKPEFTLDDIRPYEPKAPVVEPPVVTPPKPTPTPYASVDETQELRPYIPSERWTKLQDINAKKEWLANETARLNQMDSRLERAKRMLAERQLQAAEDAIVLRPYIPSERWTKLQDINAKKEWLANETARLNQMDSRLERAKRMLAERQLQAAEDAIVLRPYIPKQKD